MDLLYFQNYAFKQRISPKIGINGSNCLCFKYDTDDSSIGEYVEQVNSVQNSNIPSVVLILIGVIISIICAFIVFYIGNLLGPNCCYCCLSQSQSSIVTMPSYDQEYMQMSDSITTEILPLLEQRAI